MDSPGQNKGMPSFLVQYSSQFTLLQPSGIKMWTVAVRHHLATDPYDFHTGLPMEPAGMQPTPVRGLLFYLENRGSRFIWNFSKHLQDDMALYLRKQKSSSWEPQILYGHEFTDFSGVFVSFCFPITAIYYI